MASGLIIAQGVVAAGFAAWASLAVLNNLRDFKGSAGAIALTMGMGLLDQAPVVLTPLRARALTHGVFPILALVFVMLLQLAAAISGWLGVAGFVTGNLASARDLASLSLALLSAMAFVFLLGGLWFAYWIRQGELQLTHVGLLGTTIAAILLMQA